MSKELVAGEKQFVARLDKAESKIDKSLKSFVDDCIFLGEELIDIKKIIGHGGWEKFLNRNEHFRFASSRQASKFIRIAENKLFAKTFLIGETSIDGLDKSIANATPEQIEEVKKIENERLAEIEKNRLQAEREAEEATKVRKEAAEALAKQPLPEQSTPSNEPIEGDFKEVKPKKEDPEPEPEHNIELQEAVNILSERNDELEAEILSVCKVFESNDQLATAAAEIKKLTAVNVGLQSRVTGAQNERTELIRTLNYWKKRAEKAEKKLQENGIAV
jgi:hypothetical protein